MTKQELINKLAKRAGVSYSGEKIFFEIFLKKAFNLLKTGEAIKIRDLGYFYLRRGKIKNSVVNEEENNESATNLLLFAESKEELENKNYLLFNIPEESEEEYNFVDSFFSLSIGKPVIPLQGVKSDEFFIPPSENELRRLYDSKVEKILQEIEIILSEGKEDEIIMLEPESAEGMKWSDEVSDKIDYKSIIEKESDTEDEETETKEEPEIKEESEYQSPEEKAEESYTGEDLTNVEDDDSVKGEFAPGIESHETDDELIIDDTQPGISDYNVEADETSEPEHDHIPEIEENEEDLKNQDLEKAEEYLKEFNEASLTEETSEETEETEIENLSEELIIDEPEVFEEDKETAELEPVKEIIDGFEYVPPVSSALSSEMNFKEIDWDAIDNEDLFKRDDISEFEKIDENGFVEVNVIGQEDFSITGEYEAITADNEETISEKDIELTEGITKKKKSYGVLIGSIVAVIILAAAAFYYYYFYLQSGTGETASQINNSDPTIINRDYDVPVSYPQDEKKLADVKEFDAVDPDAVNNETTATEQTNKPVESVTETAGEKQPSQFLGAPAEKPERVSGYIYKLNNEFFVQLSSWKYRKNADEHVQSLQSKGFDAYLEAGSVSGEQYYKVRVRGFNSEEEARDFFRKNN